MARRGEVIQAPLLGQRIEFETTGGDTDGELTVCHHFIEPKPRSVSPPEHRHRSQSEHYRVVSGSFGVRVAGVEHILGPGEELNVPIGTPHLWWNDDHGETHVRVEFRPAGSIETFFETLFGLARDGGLDSAAHPKSFLQAVALSYEHGVLLAEVPYPVQRFGFPVLALVGRGLGVRGRYPKYSRP